MPNHIFIEDEERPPEPCPYCGSLETMIYSDYEYLHFCCEKMEFESMKCCDNIGLCECNIFQS